MAVARFSLQEMFESFESLVNPECLIPETSIAIHHITPDMVVDKPPIAALLPKLLPIIGKNTIVGHGVGFDIDMIATAAERAGILCTLRNNRYLDTLRMARLYGESPTNSLEQLRRHFNIEAEGAHRAMSDVLVNIKVFNWLARRYNTTEQLFNVLDKPIQLKIMPLGKHKGRPFNEVPIQYLQWIIKKEFNFDQDLLFSIHSEIKRRKKGNLFSQAGNPFLDL